MTPPPNLNRRDFLAQATLATTALAAAAPASAPPPCVPNCPGPWPTR